MTAPTNLEQLYVELINDARLNPQQNAARYIASYTPLTSSNSDVQAALNFFGVNGTALQAALNALTPVQPLAWNDALGTAAKTHTELMIATDTQSHQVLGESDIGTRISAAGYGGWSALAENIFAFSVSPLHGHAGFMVDWGSGPNGMQSPAGHRNTVMSAAYREIGVGVSEDSSSATSVGPQVVTEDFGARFGGPQVLVLGAIYSDGNLDNFYSLGEGQGGVAIGAGSANTVSAASGGYTLGLAAGTHAITFSGGAVPATLTFTTTLGAGTNAKIDIVGGATLKASVAGVASGPISRLEGLGMVGLSLAGDNGNQTIVGTVAADNLTGAGGNDVLEGRAGVDTLNGGDGDDKYILNASEDVVTESLNAGTDIVESSATYTLPVNVENLALTGTGNIDGTGNGLSNAITGNRGHNALAGGAGNDTLAGGPGFVPSFGVWVDWTSGVTATDRAVDVNSDHRADLIQFGVNQVSVALSSGSAFGAWTPWASGVTASDQVIDLNADGNADLLQLWNGRAIAALSTGSGFGSWRDWASGVAPTDRAVDVNGDQRADLVQFYGGRVLVALSNGTTFGAWQDWATGVTPRDQIVDLNADGNADLLQLYQGRALVALSNGSGFGAWGDWTTGVTPADRAADINADHRADLLQFVGETVMVAMSTGSAFRAWTAGAGGITQSDKTVDVNGDGSSDLLQFYQGRALVALATLLSSGDDLLSGGPSNDRFVFSSRFDHDEISDFAPGADTIEFERAKFADFADLSAHTANDGAGNTVITYDANNSVKLLGVLEAQLSAADFHFS